MEDDLRVCAHCRVLVEPHDGGWRHVPEFAERFTRAVCEHPEPGRVPSGSEARFGLAREKKTGGDKLALRDALDGYELPPGEPVTIAASGSYKLTVDGGRVIKPMSWGYLSSDGRYGLGTAIISGALVGGERVLQAELRAIAHAVAAMGDLRPLDIQCCSKDAINFLWFWREGYDVMPGGYDTARSGGRESTLGRLARTMRMSADRISVQWVSSEAGDPLLDGAAELAKLGRAWATSRRDKYGVAQEAQSIASEALNWHCGVPVS